MVEDKVILVLLNYYNIVLYYWITLCTRSKIINFKAPNWLNLLAYLPKPPPYTTHVRVPLTLQTWSQMMVHPPRTYTKDDPPTHPSHMKIMAPNNKLLLILLIIEII